MKKIFKLVIFYSIGFACIYGLSWRVNSINYDDNKLADNYTYNDVCNNTCIN